ncbi:glycoside hydrolase [Macellibacteroides sp. HH-ZS]|nr:glycoside hydrolase [Macellibacteroides sp. HH-ZS]
MKKKLLFLLFLSLSQVISAQITEVSENNWLLETKSMSYRIGVSGSKLNAYYYGPKLVGTSSNNKEARWTGAPEVPVRGVGAWNNPVLEAVFSDQVRDIDLTYVNDEVFLDADFQVLRITQKDTYYPLQVCVYYRVMPQYDLIEKWIEVTNTGKKEDILVENVQSGALWLPASSYELTHLSGSLRNEFQPQVTRLTQGVKTIQCRDFKSYGSSYFAVRPEGEQNEFWGDVWYGQLLYSGVWKMDFELLSDGGLQIAGGIRFWDSWLSLKPGQSFTTPKLCYGFTQGGSSAVSQNFANYARSAISPKEHRDIVRPVIYNSWYATEFNVNEAQQLSLAKVAKEIGVEMFVIDDGWFKGRINDQGGLGDWTVDKNKFPNGLGSLIKQVNDMGMDFGIWVEPEMVNPNSDLYRSHPDWIFYFPNRTRTLGRNQAMLNLAREDVYTYLYNSLSTLLRSHNIKYLKWDMNRHLTEPGWPSADVKTQREVRIRYVENLYRLVDRLKNEFPDVWFETCSSGGGRVDLGMFSRMDVAWASDNIDPLDRIYIQYGFLGAFPANTMVSWTGHEDWHSMSYSLDFRFDVAMSGVLGVGHDITKWGTSEKSLAKEKIALYKEIRPLVHNGVLFRLSSPYQTNRSVLQYVAQDGSETVIFCYNTAEQLVGGTTFPLEVTRLKCKGLIADKIYVIEGEKSTYTGSYLMNTGIIYPVKGICKSKIIRIKQKL